jgi:hypothetical protein
LSAASACQPSPSSATSIIVASPLLCMSWLLFSRWWGRCCRIAPLLPWHTCKFACNIGVIFNLVTYLESYHELKKTYLQQGWFMVGLG